MFVRRKVHVHLTFLLFFMTLPMVTRSAHHHGWKGSAIANGKSPWNNRFQQCSREDGKCFYSHQCCPGLVCLQAGYSDGHCIKKTSLQYCTRSSDCPDGCVCEFKGLNVDGVNGFCVARMDLGVRRGQHFSPMRAGLRSGAGGMINGGSVNPRDLPRENTLERIHEETKMKEEELQGIIQRLEKVKHPGHRRGYGSGRSNLPPRSVSYLSVRSLNPAPIGSHEELLIADLTGTTLGSEGYSAATLTPQERYKLFCELLQTAPEVAGGGGHVTGEITSKHKDGAAEFRLGQICRTSSDCRGSDALDRWQVCCARVNILRQGVKVICERMSPITRCID